MFVPAEMSELEIFVFEKYVAAVTQALGSMGVMHLLDSSSLGDWAETSGTEWAGRVRIYGTQERRTLEILDYLKIEELPTSDPEPLDPAGDVAVIEEQLHRIEDRVYSLRDRETALKRDLDRWNLFTQSLQRLVPLSISISDLQQLQHLHLVVGTLPAGNLARLEESLFRIPYSIVPMYVSEGQALIFAFCARNHAPILDRALDSAFLDPLVLPEELGGTAQEALEQVETHKERTRATLQELQQASQGLADEMASTLLLMLGRVRRDRAIADAMSHFGRRGDLYLIAGWVPKDKVKAVGEAIEQAAEGKVTAEENPPQILGERRKVPTLLRNSKLFRPVETLVTTYGVPGYREIDPTPLVGVTFVIMFGMMFGDLGHGLILAALGAVLALRLLPPLAKQANMGAILLACGLSSSVFGLLYGSLFGLEDVIPHLWLQPMKDILALLGASVAFGVVLLNIGFGFKLAAAARRGTLLEAIFDKNGVLGLLIYWSLGSVVILTLTGSAIPGWVYAVIAFLILTLFFGEPLTNLVRGRRPLVHGSPLEFTVQAFFEVFEALIGYISNTLSWVRLGAFAVAHAGLSMVVFMLADMLGSGASGGVVRLLIIVLGSLVVVGFEGLIVAIQALRLEYYELFGKFYLGEGVRFEPFTLSVSAVQTPERS